MNSNDEMYGTLLFFRRDGRAGTNYPLCGGKTTIGSSTEADIRLKLNDDRLELIHCVIDVNQNGIATLVNQSVAAPVKVNTINVRKYKVLNHEDRIELIGKQFQYLNEVISVEDVEKQKKTLSQVLLTPSRQRKSIAPLIRNSKNTPTLKTKTPTQRRTTVRKSIAGSGAEFVTSLTPISKSNRSGIKEKFKTTSKVVVSKALGSSKSSRRRRLSLGNNPKESGNTPKVSARNIVLSKGVVSSTTTEENRDLIKPSVSMKYLDTLCENAGFLDETNNSIKTLDDSPPQRRASLKTPSKSSARIHVSEATPKIATPVNKRMESFKTPLSLKKSSPLFKSSPKALSVKRTLNTSEDVNTPIRVLKKSTVNKNSLVSSPKIIGRNTPKLSARKRNRKSEGHNESKEIIETVEELVQPKSAKKKFKAARNTRKKLASSDSETGSQFEEVALNLSSSSSVSPLTKNGGISSDDASPRRSVLKKALGKSQMRAVSSSDRRQSSTIGAIESPGLRKSSRRSSLHEASMADCQQELQKNGHPKEAFARKSVLRNSSVIEKDQEMSRFAKKSRQSLKRSDETDESDDSLHVNLSVHRSQSTSKQSLRQSNALERASLTKSRTSKRKSKANDKYFGEDYVTGSSVNKSLKSTNGKNFNEEQNSQLLSSEDSLHLNLSSDDDSPLHAETSLNESIKSQRPSTVSSIGRLSRTSSVKRVDEDTNSYENPQSEEERDSDGDEFIKRRSSARKSFEYQKSSINRSNRMIDGEAETSFDNISRRSSYRINTASGSSKTYDNDSVQPVSEDESVYSLETSDDSKSVRSMVRKTALSSTRSEYDTSEAETSTNKSTSRRGSLIKSTPLNKSQRTSLDASAQNISVITLNDSNDSTPENHTSIIFLDTPFDKSQQNISKHRLSKTLNSTIQDALELATPKSVLKNRRSKSAVYKPITEDITLVSPLEESRTESGFKTPLNTPGLFENIKKSVLKSRSRVQRSNSSLMEELNKAECGRKRRRSWSVGSVRSAKRKKMEGMSESSVVSDSEYQSSIDSFSTDEVLSDIADQNVVHTTPRHFSDLTDKPLINEPKTRSLSEPKRVKSTAARRSLHAMRLESKITPVNSKNSEDVISATFISSQEDDSVFGESFDSNVSSRKSSRRSSLPNQSPDSTPDGIGNGDVQSTKNDLGVKKTPKIVKSPKNDLMNIVGFKKIFNTPKEQSSPVNNLTKIPNLRTFFSPKQNKSPKNDLSDVAGLKKLLATPKQMKSPENDLRKIPNLRRFMSPKHQNSPKNDLSDVAEPQNDLSDVEGVTNIFNVSGVQRLSNESDIENNEDLFEKLFAKKTLKTYRGRSLSPTTRKSIIFSGDTRKTLGDVSLASPRVKKMGVHLKKDLDEQGLVGTIEAARRTPRGKRKIEDDKPIQEETKTGPRGRRRIEELVNAERTESPKRSPRGRKRLVDTPEQNDVVLCETTEETKFPRGRRNRPKDLGCDGKTDSPKRTPRGGKKLVEKEEKPEKTTDEEVQEEKVATKPGRGRRRVEQLVEEAKQESPKKSPRGRKKAQLVEEKLVETITELTGTVDEEIEFKVKKPTRGRGKANKNTKQIADAHEEDSSSNTAVFKVPSVKATRSKRAPKKENNEDQVAEVHSTTGDINSPAPRANKKDDSDDGASTDSKIVIVPKRRGRPRKIRSEEAVDSSEKSEVRRGQLENVPKEETLPKARGRKRVASKNDNLIEVPIDCRVVLEELPLKRTGRKKIIEEEALSESPVVPQKSIKRGRKQVISDADSENIEKELSDELVKIGKTRGRPKAQLQRPQETGDDVEEAESAKPTRGRRRGANQQLDEEETKVDVAKKPTRGRKVDSEKLVENTRNKGGKEDQPLKETADEVEFENVEPVKSSRNRREKKNQPIEEAVEVKVPAKTGKRPRGKALEEAVVVDVDSPRTVRLRRGNFKKYGIEFVVDSEEMSDTGLKKKVHFNDNADDGEKKRNRRNVEEVEEATRRSKRTRK
ncbi:hypothetical protein NQ317_002845 [Molorchus minor]|uniref:FHA domain-containing protein n=1 Tax=Molorchus minor TaxID=1323400 RepID=A0ABQ9JX01_9CUCU|nr:hypothetical protein NQ317_002845 [Molorchus minor]